MLLNRKNIKIKNEYIYDSLKDLVGLELISETAEDVLLKFIDGMYNDNSLENVEKEGIQLSEFIKLNRILYSSIGHTVLANICIGTQGYKTLTYKLLGYKLSYPEKRLTLDVDRKDDVYSVEFYPINSIDFHIGEERSNVWIYTGDSGVRKLTFNYEKLVNDDSEAYFEKEVMELPFDKFIDTDRLVYQLEKKKFDFLSCKSEEKLIVDKLGQKVYLLNIQEDEKNGTIYFIGENHSLGELYYYINGDQIEVIDIQNDNSINRGIGTEAIRMLYAFAKNKSMSYIIGTLSPVDIDHRGRQIHFYSNNGFKIDLMNSKIKLEVK